VAPSLAAALIALFGCGSSGGEVEETLVPTGGDRGDGPSDDIESEEGGTSTAAVGGGRSRPDRRST